MQCMIAQTSSRLNTGSHEVAAGASGGRYHRKRVPRNETHRRARRLGATSAAAALTHGCARARSHGRGDRHRGHQRKRRGHAAVHVHAAGQLHHRRQREQLGHDAVRHRVDQHADVRAGPVHAHAQHRAEPQRLGHRDGAPRPPPPPSRKTVSEVTCERLRNAAGGPLVSSRAASCNTGSGTGGGRSARATAVAPAVHATCPPAHPYEARGGVPGQAAWPDGAGAWACMLAAGAWHAAPLTSPSARAGVGDALRGADHCRGGRYGPDRIRVRPCTPAPQRALWSPVSPPPASLPAGAARGQRCARPA